MLSYYAISTWNIFLRALSILKTTLWFYSCFFEGGKLHKTETLSRRNIFLPNEFSASKEQKQSENNFHTNDAKRLRSEIEKRVEKWFARFLKVSLKRDILWMMGTGSFKCCKFSAPSFMKDFASLFFLLFLCSSELKVFNKPFALGFFFAQRQKPHSSTKASVFSFYS